MSRSHNTITGARPATTHEELIRVQSGASRRRSLYSDTPASASDQREFDLAVRELEFKRREEVLRRAEETLALPRVAAEYFDAGHNSDEDGWWARQLGSK